MNKDQQRIVLRSMRNQQSIEETTKKSAMIQDKLTALPIYQQSTIIMTYLSAKNEPDTLKLVECAWNDNKRVVVPVTDMKTGHLHLSYLENMGNLEKSKFGIYEPKQDKIIPCEPTLIDLILIPGLGFDIQGGRLGYGKGFYDRFLPKTIGIRMALCYDFQVINQIATQEHDIPMQFILTEKRLIDCENS